MKLLQSIRFRIIIACILFAITTSIFFGYLVIYGLKFNEDEMFNWYIAQEAEKLVQFYNISSKLSIHSLSDGQIIIANEENALKKISTYYSSLPMLNEFEYIDDINSKYHGLVGPVYKTEQGFTIYEFEYGETLLHILKAKIKKNDLQSLYYIVDVTGFGKSENYSAANVYERFIYTLIFILVLAVIIGLQLAKQVVSPLTRLTQSVDGVGHGGYNLSTESYYNDEVGYLAKKIDSFVIRTRDFVAREKTFTRDASHELRTPIASSRAALELVQSLPESKNAEMEKYLSRIERANKDMTHLIETFLLLGREQEDSTKHINFNLFKLVNLAFEKHEHLIKSNSVQWENSVPNKLILCGPEPYLSIVIDNVVRNALQHTVNGSINVSVEGGDILVADTGEGINATNTSSMYELNIMEKAGFGLSIVQRICTNQGWGLGIESKTESGTLVTITINLAEAP